MKNIKILATILGVIFVVGAGYYFYTDMKEQQMLQQQREEQAKAEQAQIEQKRKEAADLLARTKCQEVGDYSLITLDRDGSVGQDIIVRKKVTSESCKYEVLEGDFELKNIDPQYFKALSFNALVTDVGTGPSGRSFRLYDLKDKNMIVEKKYFDELTISSSTLTYFGLSKTAASMKNCTDFDKITKDGFTPNLVVKKTIDLKTYAAKEGKETKCVASQ